MPVIPKDDYDDYEPLDKIKVDNNILSENDREDILAGLSNNLYHKKCPFCRSSSQESYVTDFGTKYAVVCSVCGAIGPKAETKEKARERWNARGHENVS